MTLDDVRAFRAARFVPADATLIVAGDLDQAAVVSAARAALGAWTGEGPGAPPSPRAAVTPAAAAPSVLFVARPRAPQSELRIGHVGPPRDVAAYHASSRSTPRSAGSSRAASTDSSREEGPDLRRAHGVRFPPHGRHVRLRHERAGGRDRGSGPGRARRVRSDSRRGQRDRRRAGARQGLVTRGYVRTSRPRTSSCARAVQLATYGLPDDTFDRFVPDLGGQPGRRRGGRAGVPASGGRHVGRRRRCRRCRAQVEALGRPVTTVTPEF